MDKITTTYSMWRSFRNCRRACKYRYIEELVLRERDPVLYLGQVIHRGLEAWYTTSNLPGVLEVIDKLYANRAANPKVKHDWHIARAMMQGYVQVYPREEFELVDLEMIFKGPIVNPATGALSKTFLLAGKVDGVIRNDQGLWLLEHKTASVVDAAYLESLWTDFQIVLYCHYLERELNTPVAGVIYNILCKTRLEQGEGETEIEFAAREKELILKSKTGKTTAKRKMPETDDAFQERLAAKYRGPGMFHREMIYVSRDRADDLQTEVWELTQAFLDARRRGVFYQNTDFCFHYRRPCPYLPLCRSNGSMHVVENLYQRVPPHEELRNVIPEAASGF